MMKFVSHDRLEKKNTFHASSSSSKSERRKSVNLRTENLRLDIGLRSLLSAAFRRFFFVVVIESKQWEEKKVRIFAGLILWRVRDSDTIFIFMIDIIYIWYIILVVCTHRSIEVHAWLGNIFSLALSISLAYQIELQKKIFLAVIAHENFYKYTNFVLKL